MVRIERCVGIGAVAFAVLAMAAGCGGGSDAPKNDSFAAISESISKPTGTVDQTTAGKIGAEFDKTMSAGAGASSAFGSVRGDDQVAATGTASETFNCPQGGSIAATGTATGDSSNASGHVEEHIDHCCYSAGCCADGNANLYFSGATSTGSGGSSSTSVTANYSYCMNVDVDASCNGNSYSGTFSGCLGAGGSWTYNISVDGKTFSVSGDYGSGSGTLTVQGANGTFTCTYTSGSGSCTGPSGNFSFSASS